MESSFFIYAMDDDEAMSVAAETFSAERELHGTPIPPGWLIERQSLARLPGWRARWHDLWHPRPYTYRVTPVDREELF